LELEAEETVIGERMPSLSLSLEESQHLRI